MSSTRPMLCCSDPMLQGITKLTLISLAKEKFKLLLVVYKAQIDQNMPIVGLSTHTNTTYNLTNSVQYPINSRNHIFTSKFRKFKLHELWDLEHRPIGHMYVASYLGLQFPSKMCNTKSSTINYIDLGLAKAHSH